MNTTSFQSSIYKHSFQSGIHGHSGLKIMDGQDLTSGDRRRIQQLQSNAWWKQQMQQKERNNNMKKMQNQIFDQQTLQINEMRRQLQQQKANRLRNMQIAYKNNNKQQLQQKLNKQRLDRNLDTQQRKNHIEFLTGHDFYTQNPDTCQSMLSRNRVLPYHWKGMNEAQRQRILDQQQKQRQDKLRQKQLEEQQDKLFAQQMQAQRLAIVLQAKNKAKGLNDVRKGMDEYNRLKAQQMKKKAYHAYDYTQTYKNQ